MPTISKPKIAPEILAQIEEQFEKLTAKLN